MNGERRTANDERRGAVSAEMLGVPPVFNAATHFVDRNVTEGRGNRVAIECGDARITYADVLQHVNRCGNCADEVKAFKGLRDAMSVVPMLEPTPSLLASSRMQLQEALEIAQQDRGWKRWFYDPFAMIGQLKFSPALAAVLLMIGFGGGAGVAYKVAHNSNPGTGVTTAFNSGRSRPASSNSSSGL